MKIFKHKDSYHVVPDDARLRHQGEVEVTLDEAMPFLDKVSVEFLKREEEVKQSLVKPRSFAELADKMVVVEEVPVKKSRKK